MSRILIVRGDLRSNNGYSRALRAHIALLTPFFEQINGVDIHFHPVVSKEKFSGAILAGDHEVEGLISASKDKEVWILNYSTPDNFIRHPRAKKNIGLFYWETDRLSSASNWDSYIHLMDEMWIPTTFNGELLKNIRFAGSVHYVPWPQTVSKEMTEPCELKKIEIKNTHNVFYFFRDVIRLIRIKPVLRIVDRMFQKNIETHHSVDSRTLRKNYDRIFLSVLQNAPRKGLSLTLTEWFQFKKKYSRHRTCLILKVNSLNIHESAIELHLNLQRMIADIGAQFGDVPSDIYVCTEKVPFSQIEELYSISDALLTTTLGEGFGGPMVEFGIRGKVVIAPLHSSLIDVLPVGWQFSLPSENVCLSIKDQLSCYSLSSKWGLIQKGSLAEKMQEFCEADSSQLKVCEKQIESHCASQFSFTSISKRLISEGIL